MKDTEHISFRAPKVTGKELDDLIKAWGTNQSQTCIRAIHIAWEQRYQREQIPLVEKQT